MPFEQPKRTVSTGNPEIDAMVEATINFTDQLVFMSTLIEKISQNTTTSAEFISDKDGLVKMLQNETESIKEKLEKFKVDYLFKIDSIKAEVIQKHDTVKVELVQRNDSLKNDLIQKFDTSIKSAVMKINIMYLGSLAVFGFIVYIINLIFANQASKELANLLIKLGK